MHRLVLLFALLFAASAHAAPDYTVFAQLPVQHEGRIKPLGSLATVELERLHGSASVDGKPAIAWLAGAMFDPVSAMDEPLFTVKDDVQAMLNLPAQPGNIYTFAELAPALGANERLVQSLEALPESGLSPGQRELMDVYHNVGEFNQIILSCTLFLPVASVLDPGEGASQPPTFADFYRRMPEWEKQLRGVIARKGTDPAKYTPQEQQLAEGMHQLSVMLDNSRDNVLLSILPPQWGKSDAWLSPWAAFHRAEGSPQTAQLMRLWRELALAYQQKDDAAWNSAAQKLQAAEAGVAGVRPAALQLEVLYYRLDPLGIAMGLYMAAFVAGLFMWRLPRVRLAAMALAGTGAALHGASIAARIYILQRPPVGTLYESQLFVSLIALLFGLYLERRLKNGIPLLAATLAGSILLGLSQHFGRGDDTMSMLIAVLNTNFWLATHVLCITTGYAFGIIAAIMAHGYLILRCAHADAERVRQVLKGAYATALIALLFATLGTLLGGIWADQSWGRFWGWDPKENGALLICLWLIWTLHGRISRHFEERGFAVALALLNIPIALSWLGVNLLATGLHSYGFTDKAAYVLAGFCAAECAFAFIAFMLLRRVHAPAH